MSSKKKRKLIPQRKTKGVATGVHNALLDRLRETQRRNTMLQQLLACVVHSRGEPLIVDLVDVPGDWVLTLDEVPTIEAGRRALKVDLIDQRQHNDARKTPREIPIVEA